MRAASWALKSIKSIGQSSNVGVAFFYGRGDMPGLFFLACGLILWWVLYFLGVQIPLKTPKDFVVFCLVSGIIGYFILEYVVFRKKK